MKKTLSILGMCTLILLGTACSNDDDNNIGSNTRKDIQLTRTEQEMVKASNGFAIDFFRNINAEENGNVLVSPLSLSSLLAMTNNGAVGNTETELLKALGFENQNAEEVNAYYKNLVNGLLTADKTTKIGWGNSMWINKAHANEVKPTFKETISKEFGAELYTLAFDKKALDKINDWSYRKTNGCVPEILDELSPNAISVLMNALYFKGIWKDPFEKKYTKSGNFWNNGKPVFTKFMCQKMMEIDYYASEAEGVQLIELPYGNEAFSMVVVLPNEGVEINNCIQDLTAEKWQNWMGSAANKIVNVELPKFKGEFTYEENLKSALQSMGIKDLFNADKCDLSGIANNLLVSMIKQNTFIEVNEEGTEAAAVTGGEMIGSSGKELIVIDFIANRPFFYAIKEKSTNAILFMGKVTNPKE